VKSDDALIKAGGVRESNIMISVFMAHNHHTLAFAASSIGQSKLAIEHIHEMIKVIPKSLKETIPHFADFFGAGPYEFFVRLGEWDKMLSLPPPDPALGLATTFYHGCRAVSLAALKRPQEARVEQKLALKAADAVNPAQKYIVNTAQGYLDVLKPYMEGELLISEGKRDQAVEKFTTACEFVDKLGYEHPPMFIVSPRHPLGALLIELGRPKDAIELYKRDLVQWPNNGWALKGLHQSYARLSLVNEAQQNKKKFDEVWAKADMKTESSCCCLPGGKP